MRVHVVGFGSIGARHLRLLRKYLPENALSVVSHRELPDEFRGITHYSTPEQALKSKPDLTFITNPAPQHIQTALFFARAGSHLFIEKPLSCSLAGVDELMRECAKRKLVVMVGYMLRFFEPLVVVKQAILGGKIGRILSISAHVGQYLPDWRPGRDYQETVSAKKAMGGGVVLELSHELDSVRWLVGEVASVSATTTRVGDLDIDVEDIAEITLTFGSGAVGHIHLDMLDRAVHRDCRIVGSTGTIVWRSEDSHRVQLRSSGASDWADLRASGPIEADAMYLAQLKHLLACVEGRAKPLVSLEDGRKTLEFALAVKESALSGAVIRL